MNFPISDDMNKNDNQKHIFFQKTFMKINLIAKIINFELLYLMLLIITARNKHKKGSYFCQVFFITFRTVGDICDAIFLWQRASTSWRRQQKMHQILHKITIKLAILTTKFHKKSLAKSPQQNRRTSAFQC